MSASSLIFRNRQFFWLWLGQVTSQGGTRMYQIAILWWILHQEQLPVSEGMAAAIFLVLGALPSVLLARLIGRTIDQMRAKSILMWSESVAALIMAAVVLAFTFGAMSLYGLYLASIGLAACQAFVDPTLNKAVPEVVDAADIENGVAFVSSTQSLANFAGAVIGALLMDQLGVIGAVWVNFLSYVFSFLALTRLKVVTAALVPAIALGESIASLTLSRMQREMPLLLMILLGFGAVNFFSMPILVVLPLYIKNTLQADASLLAAAEAAVWLGLLAGTFSSPTFKFLKNTLQLGGACLSVFGLALLLPATVISTTTLMLGLFTAGFALGLNNVKFISLFQVVVPEAVRGQFFALLQALIGFTIPMAFFVFGALGDLYPAQTLFAIQGLGIMSVSLAYFALSSRQNELQTRGAA